VLATEYAFGAGDGALDGATSLGLVELRGDDRYDGTEQAALAAAVLHGHHNHIHDLSDLDEAKTEVHGSIVAAEHHPLAILLRNCFERHPEFRLLLDALRKEGPEIYFPDLLERLVHEYPNVFLNAFCTRSGRATARELIETG